MTLKKVNHHQYKLGSNQYQKARKSRLHPWKFYVASLLVVISVLGVSAKDVSSRWNYVMVSPIGKATASNAKVTPSTTLTPTPTPSQKDIIYQAKHGDIIYRIWGLESTFGKEPFLFCTHQGKVSDMGFNVLNHQCFSSFSAEVTTVDQWIDSHKDLPLGKLLCLYNEGNNRMGCPYSVNFLGL